MTCLLLVRMFSLYLYQGNKSQACHAWLGVWRGSAATEGPVTLTGLTTVKFQPSLLLSLSVTHPIHTFPRQQIQCLTHMMHDECYFPLLPPPLPHTYISKATNLMFNVYGVQCRLPLNTYVSMATNPVFNVYGVQFGLPPNTYISMATNPVFNVYDAQWI